MYVCVGVCMYVCIYVLYLSLLGGPAKCNNAPCSPSRPVCVCVCVCVYVRVSLPPIHHPPPLFLYAHINTHTHAHTHAHTGGCTEDCKYCSQSVRHKTHVKPTPQMKVAEVGLCVCVCACVNISCWITKYAVFTFKYLMPYTHTHTHTHTIIGGRSSQARQGRGQHSFLHGGCLARVGEQEECLWTHCGDGEGGQRDGPGSVCDFGHVEPGAGQDGVCVCVRACVRAGACLLIFLCTALFAFCFLFFLFFSSSSTSFSSHTHTHTHTAQSRGPHGLQPQPRHLPRVLPKGHHHSHIQ